MLRAIDRRVHNEYALQASFHGAKIPLRYNKEKEVEAADMEEPADSKALEQAMLQAQERVRRRYV